jgi:hypothetical protein
VAIDTRFWRADLPNFQSIMAANRFATRFIAVQRVVAQDAGVRAIAAPSIISSLLLMIGCRA